MKHAKPLRLTALALALAAASFSAHALFGDDDARRAILDLRQRLDTAITAQNKLVEDNEQMRRSMLDLQTQIETLRNELAQSRGIQEQASRELEDLRRRQQEAAQGMEDRLRKMESGDAPPASGTDGAEAADDASARSQAPQQASAEPDRSAASAKDRKSVV